MTGPLALVVVVAISDELETTSVTTAELDVVVATALEVLVSVTGQTVVETIDVRVVSTVDSAGQLVTSGPQLVIVDVMSDTIVEVVN